MLKNMLPFLSKAMDCKSNLTLSNGPLLAAVIGLPHSFPSTETGRGWGHKRLKRVAITTINYRVFVCLSTKFFKYIDGRVACLIKYCLRAWCLLSSS